MAENETNRKSEGKICKILCGGDMGNCGRAKKMLLLTPNVERETNIPTS
jgi:hypothetical protein